MPASLPEHAGFLYKMAYTGMTERCPGVLHGIE